MRIGRLFGIDITVHVSWLFVFALVTWSLASDVGPFRHLEVSGTQRVILALFTALLFFASVLAHELAHSLLARSRGIPVRGITLFIFGGVSEFGEEAPTAPASAWISAIGPLTSLALGVLFYAISNAYGQASALGTAFGYLGIANVILAVFNFIPAYPLDGGRVLQALVWRATGNRERAVRASIVVGAIIAWLFIAYGIGTTLAFGFGGGLWLTFVGWFLLQSQSAERTQLDVRSSLANHTIGELAAVPPTIGADAHARDALETMARTGSRLLAVRLGDQLLGLLSLDDLADVAPDQLDARYVTALMTRIDAMPIVRDDTSANDVFTQLARGDARAVTVVDAHGTTRGIVTGDAIANWYLTHRAVRTRA